MVLTIENLPTQVARLTADIEELKRLILALSSEPIERAEVLSIDEVCQLTGYSKHTVYQYVHKEKIPFHKPEHGGRKLIFFRSEIENWLSGKTSESSEDYCERKERELVEHYTGGHNTWN